MKKICFLSLAAIITLASCTEKLSEENLSLRLDFPAEDTHHIADGDVPSYTLHTDELTASFDILSGAGGYTAMVQEYEFMPSRHIPFPEEQPVLRGKPSWWSCWTMLWRW